MNIEIMIDEAVEQAQQRGITIVHDKWGIRNIDNEWVCLDNYCCPLGTTLLKHQYIYREEQLFKGGQPNIDLRNVRFNPFHSLIALFKVEEDWFISFMAGISNSHVGYYSDFKAYDLGFKYYKKFGQIII